MFSAMMFWVCAAAPRDRAVMVEAGSVPAACMCMCMRITNGLSGLMYNE